MGDITHALIVGVTMSGKTTLARALARGLDSRGVPVVVYDPLGTQTAGGGWGERARIFDDPDEFCDLMHAQDFGGASIFVDESHHIFGHDKRENFWMLTQGRHYGMQFNLITQRPHKLHPDVRSNCGRAFVFRLAVQDMQLLGGEFGHSNFARHTLDRGDFLAVESGSDGMSRHNVFSLVNPSKDN